MKRQQRLPQPEYDPTVCLVCGRKARPFSSREVPELLHWVRGETGGPELTAAVWKAFPGVEGCFIAPATGVSVCATQGVCR